VEGQHCEPYRITIHCDPGGVRDVICTCPYDGSGVVQTHCRGALGLRARTGPDRTPASLEQLLEPLTREQLQSVLRTLATEHPELGDAIAGQITLLQATPTSEKLPRSVRRTTVDPNPFRRQVQHILQSAAGLGMMNRPWKKSAGCCKKPEISLSTGMPTMPW